MKPYLNSRKFSQFVIFRLKYLQNLRQLTPSLTDELVSKAQSAYNGILSFVRDLNPRRSSAPGE